MAAANSADVLQDSATLALEAFRRGREATAAGNQAEALRWFDRAHRLAPRDQTAALALATACLGQDDQRATALLAAITADNDVREAWLGLATARRRVGDTAGAAAALAEALRRHVPGRGEGVIADVIAREAGAPGWCGLSGDGKLTIRAHAGSPPSIAMVRPGSRDRNVRHDGAGRCSIQLPPGWQKACLLTVTIAKGHHLLGSPIDIAAITATTGCVSGDAGRLSGWAWHPGDPDTDPVLTISPATGARQISVTASDTSLLLGFGLLARPRGFIVPAAALDGMTGPLHVRGRDGKDLLGSPLDPRMEAKAGASAAEALANLYPAGHTITRTRVSAPPPAMPVAKDVFRPKQREIGRARAASVVVPVYGGTSRVLACLDSVLRCLGEADRLVVVDDASPEPELRRALQELARERRFRLIRHDRNQGFGASANTGMLAAAGRDVVLLNSDTLVTSDWLEDLRAVVYSAPDIGTATPLSNDATILSYPDPAGGNATPDLAATRRLATMARRTNRGASVDIPVGVGFCMYIRRACLDEVGLLRADVFAQGYGEENDFCLRARHLGWRHVAAPGVFVAHVGGQSFGAAALHLRTRNEAVLERLHPGYARLIEAHVKADPLASARRWLDLARWHAAGSRDGEAIIIVTHSAGGGVEQRIEASVRRHQARGHRAIVLRPGHAQDGTRCITLDDGTESEFPNLRYAMPAELPALRRLLAREHPRAIELHHMVGHDPSVLALIASLGTPYDVHVHDYAWLCARVVLVGPTQRYCGEPDSIRCEACIADAGSLIEEDISVAALRRRSAQVFAGARRVIVPSEDAASRIRRHFPATRPQVQPHEDDTAIAEPPPLPAAVAMQCRVCIVGAIGIHKGYQVVLDCARDAAERDLPLDFVIVGHTIDDSRLLATGRVFITGSFALEEAVDLIKAQNATLALLPSICPETWCLGLAEAWRAGLRVAAFDIGAQAERIRRTGRGFLLPLGLPPQAINNALVDAAQISHNE